jgi:hypothetical protein
VLGIMAGEKFCTTREMISWKGQASDGHTTAVSYLATGLAAWVVSPSLCRETRFWCFVDSSRFFPAFPSLRTLGFVDGPMDSEDGTKTRSYWYPPHLIFVPVHWEHAGRFPSHWKYQI